jgi:hypothetical protein
MNLKITVGIFLSIAYFVLGWYLIMRPQVMVGIEPIWQKVFAGTCLVYGFYRLIRVYLIYKDKE